MAKLLSRSCSVGVITLPWVTGLNSKQPKLKPSSLLFKTLYFDRVFMDQHGDVEGNYTLVSAQPLKRGGIGLLPTGRFVLSLLALCLTPALCHCPTSVVFVFVLRLLSLSLSSAFCPCLCLCPQPFVSKTTELLASRFYLASQLNLNDRAQPLPLLGLERPIAWPGGSPPRDRPIFCFRNKFQFQGPTKVRLSRRGLSEVTSASILILCKPSFEGPMSVI